MIGPASHHGGGAPLPGPADHDRRTRALHRPGLAPRVGEPVVATRERHRRAGEQALTFGSWSTDSAELAQAATAARAGLVETVRAAQDGGDLPPGDPERVAALVLAVAHGAADLEISGHRAKTGKGHASAEDLVDDLLRHQARAG